MIRSTKLAAAVMSGVLLVAAYAPAWAGSASDPSTAATTASAGSDRSLVNVLSPVLNVSAQHQAQKNCKADTLYSQHSVVGDPDACFMSKVDVRAGSINTGIGGIF